MEFFVGYGQREITPPMGVELSGYGYFLQRRCDAVQDPLYARAVAFRQQDNTQLIINCDLLGLGPWMVDAVRGALNQWYGLSAEQVLLLSIHTHTGPTTGGLPGCGDDSRLAHSGGGTGVGGPFSGGGDENRRLAD